MLHSSAYILPSSNFTSSNNNAWNNTSLTLSEIFRLHCPRHKHYTYADTNYKQKQKYSKSFFLTAFSLHICAHLPQITICRADHSTNFQNHYTTANQWFVLCSWIAKLVAISLKFIRISLPLFLDCSMVEFWIVEALWVFTGLFFLFQFHVTRPLNLFWYCVALVRFACFRFCCFWLIALVGSVAFPKSLLLSSFSIFLVFYF